MAKHDPPRHLSTHSRTLWRDIRRSHDVDDPHSRALLTLALEALDRAAEARRLIELDGAVVKDRFGQYRSHPACSIERDARAAVLAAFRALRLAPPEA